MKIALIQMKGKNSNDDNIEIALEQIEKASASGAEFVVLPEMFSCPYKASNFPVYAQKDGGKNCQKLSECGCKKKQNLSCSRLNA